MTNQRRAVALISGGLDSMLATQLILDQGIHVEGINFYTGFCVEGHTHAIRKKDRNRAKRNDALWVAEQLGIKLHIIDVIEEYKDVLLNPKHGYGANMNPCLDCKCFMVGKARKWMSENNFDFIITGEVLGQRPMSQRRDAMQIVVKNTNTNDCLLRPLCAQRLPETRPETEGWVDRKRLLGLTGRSRKPQIELAKNYGFNDYSQPAGGCCFLTDEAYSTKLVDMWTARNDRDYDLDDIMLLKVGRHLRPKPHFKIIVGREEGENRFLEGYRKQFIHLRATHHAGPLVLLDGKVQNKEEMELAARLCARFSQGKNEPVMAVTIKELDKEEYTLDVNPMNASDIPKSWYL